MPFVWRFQSTPVLEAAALSSCVFYLWMIAALHWSQFGATFFHGHVSAMMVMWDHHDHALVLKVLNVNVNVNVLPPLPLPLPSQVVPTRPRTPAVLA